MLIEEQNGNFAKPVLPAVPSSEVYLEDCVTALKRYADNHFDLAIVDPPYGIEMAKTTNIPNPKKGFRGNKLHNEKEWDNEIPSEEYFLEVQRVSKNQIIWGGNYFTEYLKPTKAWIFWSKKETKTQGSNFSDGELAWTSFKKVTRLFEYGWIGIDYCNKSETKIHPTQKPVTLYDWLLMNYAEQGDLILDTHLGSGSSRIAAYKGGFNFVGFEIDQEYYEKQEKRFNDFKSQLRLF
ncbi:MAG TPA: DNA methyltransferase [Methanosarcina sp.]|nr:DNA methyltransferase [Methanosarcina sp.]